MFSDCSGTLLELFVFIDVVDKVEWFYFEVCKLFPVLSVIHKARVATHLYHSLPHTTWIQVLVCSPVLVEVYSHYLSLHIGLLCDGLLQEPQHVSAHGSSGVLCGRGRSQLQQSRGAERRVWGGRLQKRLSRPAGLLRLAHQQLVSPSYYIKDTRRKGYLR